MTRLETLTQHIGLIKPQAIALLTDNKGHDCQPDQSPLIEIPYGQVLGSARQLRARSAGLKGKALAIRYQNLEDFVTALLAFDGWCAALYLLPDDCAPNLPVECANWPETAGSLTNETVGASGDIATCWYLATSGTTDTPKWIAHSLQSLIRSVRQSDRLTSFTWGLLYQPFRFAGLQVVLQALLSGASLVDASQGNTDMRIERLLKGGVEAASATSAMWRQLLMTGRLQTLRLQQLTLGGEIADQGILNALGNCFPKARIRHIYASTEAGVGFAVSDGKAGFPRVWLEQDIKGVRLKVDNKQHLWIKPPILPQSGVLSRIDQQGYLDSEDLVEIKADRVLFLGRASGAINVGGNKVHPQQVEQVLLALPSVMQARVYGQSSSMLGQLVAAEVVAAQGVDTSALKKQLMRHCLGHLQRHQIPARIQFVEQIVSNSAGKISRSHKDE